MKRCGSRAIYDHKNERDMEKDIARAKDNKKIKARVIRVFFASQQIAVIKQNILQTHLSKLFGMTATHISGENLNFRLEYNCKSKKFSPAKQSSFSHQCTPTFIIEKHR